MDDCLTARKLEDLVCGRLTGAEETRCKRHLASCSNCRIAADGMRRDRELAQDIQRAYEADLTASTAPAAVASLTEGAAVPESIAGYEILSEIHRGGQGVVYKAVQKATKRTVALKVLLQGPYASPRQRYRFEREIDLVASLQHPGIVTVYDSGVTQDRHYFAMEYIHGQSLDVYLSTTNLGIDETLRLFQKICEAVNYAHQRGVIHRDLKPANVRVDAEGEPHVLDFGLAKAAGPGLHGGAPVTVTGEFMGTLAYASPEQTKGDPNLIDIRTDVYSLGVILYEMLTGKYPYQVVGQMADVLKNIAEVAPKRPSTIRRQINDEIETIVLKALSKEKDRRYQSAENLASDIGHYLNGEPIDAKRDSGLYVLKKQLRRHRKIAIVLLLLILMNLAWGIVMSIVSARNQDLAVEKSALAESESRAKELAAKRAAKNRELVDELLKSAFMKERLKREAEARADQLANRIENAYKRIERGKDDMALVRKVLGVPMYVRGKNQWEYEWQDLGAVIYLFFDERGLVQRKEWIDSRRGVWDGAAPRALPAASRPSGQATTQPSSP